MPIHEHDCDICISLGEFNNQDLYYCPGAGKRPIWTLISRYGKHGDYQSGSHVSKQPQLGEARRRAVEAGYITADQEN